jgi:hypothetical protein
MLLNESKLRKISLEVSDYLDDYVIVDSGSVFHLSKTEYNTFQKGLNAFMTWMKEEQFSKKVERVVQKNYDFILQDFYKNSAGTLEVVILRRSGMVKSFLS